VVLSVCAQRPAGEGGHGEFDFCRLKFVLHGADVIFWCDSAQGAQRFGIHRYAYTQ
jgi:hypothetical protein